MLSPNYQWAGFLLHVCESVMGNRNKFRHRNGVRGKKKKKKRNGVRSGGEVLVQPTESGQTGPACRLVSAPGFCVAKWVCGDEDFWGVWKVPAISFSILIPAPKGPL